MPKKDPIKEQSWIKKLEQFQSSGLTAKQWCENNQEKIHTFKYWKARLTTCQSVQFEEITQKLAHKPGSYYIKKTIRPKYAPSPKEKESKPANSPKHSSPNSK